MLREEMSTAITKSKTEVKGKDKEDTIIYNITDELGTTGTKIFSGIINEEYLQEWRTLEPRCKIIDRMLRSDASIRAIYLSMVLPIESADWKIHLDITNREDAFLKEYMEKMLFKDMTITWQSFVRQALSMLPYSFSCFEEVYERDEKNQLVKIRKLAPRLQKTIKKWLIDERGGLAGIEQQAYFASKESNTWKTVKIPVDKLVVFTYRQEGSNFEGDGGILRPAYKHWFIKDKLYLIQAIGLERHALGIPVIFMPKGATMDDKNYAKHIVKTWRAHQEAGMLFPEGVKVDTIEGKFQNQALEAAIQHHDRQIGKAVLAQFMQLGSDSAGSWALSKDQSDMFLMTLNSVVKTITDTMNRYCIKPWVDMNFGKRDMYPELTCENITKTSNDDVLKALQILMQMNLIEKDEGLCEWAREKFSMPAKKELSPEEQQMKQQQEMQMQQQQAQQQAGAGGVNAKDQSANAGDVDAGPPGMGAVGPGGDGGAEMSETHKTYWDMKPPETVKFAETNITRALLHDSLNKMFDNEAKAGYSRARENAIHRGVTDTQIGSVLEYFVRPNIEKIKGVVVGHLYDSAAKAMDHLDSMAPMYRNAAAKNISRLCDINPDTLALLGDSVNYLYSFKEDDDDEHERKIELVLASYDRDEGKKVSAFNNAPTFRDPRTGKLKYAKGAVIDGKKVGGTWAHTAHDIGSSFVGMAGAGLSLGGIGIHLLKGFAGEAGSAIKSNLKDGMHSIVKSVVIKNANLGKMLLGLFGNSVEATTVKCLPYQESPTDPIRETKVDGKGDGSRIGRDKASWKITDLFTGTDSGKTKRLADGKLLKDRLLTNFGIGIPTTEIVGGVLPQDTWSKSLRIDMKKLNLDGTFSEDNEAFRKMTLDQLLPQINSDGSVSHHPSQRYRLDSIDGGIDPATTTVEHFLGDLGQRSNAPIDTRLLMKSNIKFAPRENNVGEVPLTYAEMIGQHLGLSPEDARSQYVSAIEDADSVKTSLTHVGDLATMKGWKLSGSIVNAPMVAVTVGAGLYVFSRIWRNMTTNAISHVKNYAESLTSGEMTPQEMAQYQAMLEQQRRAQSPTGGRVGRPRQKPVIPEHLKRRPGRPPAEDDPKEIERKRNIDEIVKRWEAERGGGA